ncbi:AraC family transcriptional regulator [Paenibacillus whitsoniae]|uniref:AraC family transcriptional regulator n=1 Tax=Paenibacillus whitsoniae TaxID=2496558 RepID=A0A430J5K0_9BACL|nr:AraC family transcriptional regulator [Paenibacillus whitsoniae]
MKETVDLSFFSRVNLELNDLFGKVNCEPNWRWNREHEPFHDFDLWYVWGGEGEVILGGERMQVGQGDCYLFQPGDLASARHNPERPLTVTFIHFNCTESFSQRISLPSRVRFDPADFHELYLDRFIQVRLAAAFGHEEEATLLLRLLLLAYERQAPGNQPFGDPAKRSLRRVMMGVAARIGQNPGRHYSIQELAKEAHLSPRYFSLKWKELMGQTIESYVIQKRIERAAYLLRLGMNVSEVAEALGYRSIYFFSRQFKQVTGTNPSDVLRKT